MHKKRKNKKRARLQTGFTPLEKAADEVCRRIGSKADERSSLTGFTLIELLTVISVIAFLSSIVLTTANQSRSKARDVKRIEIMNAIAKAVSLYRLDTGSSPLASKPTRYYWPSLVVNNEDYYWVGAVTQEAWVSPTEGQYSWDDLEQALSSYMRSLPDDPLDTGVYHIQYNERYGTATGSNPKTYYWDPELCLLRTSPPGIPSSIVIWAQLENPTGNGTDYWAGAGCANPSRAYMQVIPVPFD